MLNWSVEDGCVKLCKADGTGRLRELSMTPDEAKELYSKILGLILAAERQKADTQIARLKKTITDAQAELEKLIACKST